MLRSKRGSPSARPMIVAWGCFMATAGGCQKAASQPDLGPPPASIAAPVTQQAAPVSDVEITRAIERHFQDEALLRSEHLQAKVTLGIATLSGSVGNLMAKERALAVTETIRGVRAVVDEVTVVSVARTDAELERDVKSALRDDPSTRSLTIGVAAKDGVVTLSGAADSWQQRRMFADIAAEVPGVKGVDNAVVAHYGAARPPEEIASDVRHRLANDVWLDGDALTVTVTGRKVARSEAEKMADVLRVARTRKILRGDCV